MGKGVASGYRQTKITICEGCFHREMCGNRDYLSENTCCGFMDEGLVVELPCEVGTEVFVDTRSAPWTLISSYVGRRFIPGKITSFRKNGKSLIMNIQFKLTPTSLQVIHRKYVISTIGNTVFFTRAEAEKAMEEKG